MSRDIEDRLRAAYAARADTVTESSLRVAEPPSDEIQPIGDVIDISTARRRWITPALAAAAVAALAIGTSIALTVRSDHHHAPPAVTPSTIAPTLPSPVPSPSVPHQSPTTGAPTSPAPTSPAPTASATTSATLPAPPAPAPAYEFGYQPLWPFANLASARAWQAAHRSTGVQPWHADPSQTALSFTQGYLGLTEINLVTSTRVTSEGAYVGVGYRDPNGAAHTSAVLFLVRFGPDADSPWEVVGSDDTTFSLEQPAYGSQVQSPMLVGGHITGVDENIRVAVRSLGSSSPVGGSCCQPAGGNGTAWAMSVPFSAPAGTVLTIVATTGGHLQTVERFAIMGVHA
ncbi:MAG TPA: hypothetical protein VNB91_09810 [Jatrophihabitantaceae bacterium]|jgi:hypothetical protein|nr:hypothetical protein [Jatrophihabitantaceae bacterium]